MSKSLEDIKTGDYVTVRDLNGPRRISKVVRTTKTQIITEGFQEGQEFKWKRSSGYAVGPRSTLKYSYPPNIVPTTQEHVDFLHLRRLLRTVRHLVYTELETCNKDQLTKIKEILEQKGNA